MSRASQPNPLPNPPAQPTPAFNPTDDVKIPLPDKFEGQRSQFEDFLFDCNNYIRFYPTKFTTDEKQIIFMLGLLKTAGPTGQWKKNFMRQAIRQNPINYGTFIDFIRDLKARFDPIDREGTAITKLSTSKAGGRKLEDFISDFDS
jgi:hypothetical protein